MWHFNLRSILIIVAGISVSLAMIVPLVRANFFPIEIWIWITAVSMGSLAGTAYGAIVDRPESSRWFWSFGIGTIAGALAFIALYLAQGWTADASWLVLGLMGSSIPACVAASIWELIRVHFGRP